MQKPNLTLTGIDEITDLDRVEELLEANPDLEFGILYTANPRGRLRYPERHNVVAMTSRLKERCALHVCGREAQSELMMRSLRDMIHDDMRIQVNGALDLGRVEVICQLYPYNQIITQFNHINFHHLQVKAPNHQLLVDSSGGEGIEPDAWPVFNTDKYVGFAGGLCLENLPKHLSSIQLIQSEFWVDMESSLRARPVEVFDLKIAESVINYMQGRQHVHSL